ncbi:hypothetical protein CVD28_00005 [Bacillus sp. M6-12]|nr:hypothetical protein CVD28_00005 [Bacillus sp. M6-12]
MQNKPFQYILLHPIPCKIDQSYLTDDKNTKRNREYRGSHIRKVELKDTPVLSYEFLQEDNKELQLYFPSISISLSIVDHYFVTEKVLLFEKSKELDIERLFHYTFKEVFFTVPLKSETMELFQEKLTFAIYDYMEELARDIINGEVLSEEGFVLQLPEWQVDHVFDEDVLLFEP